MYKNKLKLFFISFILLSTIVMTIIIGYSLWIVGERKEVIPTYNFEDLFENNIKLEEIYNAQEFDVTTISTVKFEIDWDEYNIYYLDSEKVELTTNNKHPFNAGKYYVKIESKTLHDVDGISLRSAYVELTILKATPSINLEKSLLINDPNNTYITTNSLISNLTITDNSGVMFHDESTNDSIINGSFKIIDGITLNVGNNSVKCLFTPNDTTNFNNLEFNIDINCFAMVDFYHNDNKFIDTLYVDTINNPKISKPNSIPVSTNNGYEFDCWLYSNASWNFEDDNVCSNMVLYSSFKPIEYTITYILDGGNMNNNPSTYTIESDDITINNPTKNKHNFLGWSSNYFEGLSKDVIIKKGSTGNITLTANWERIYIFNKPAKDTTKYIYNGTQQTYTPIIDEDDLEFIEITNNVQINAGTYEVTLSLKDPSKSSWEDDTKDDLIYEFIIEPKDLTISNGTIKITNGTIPSAGSIIEYSDDVIVSIPNININGIETIDNDTVTITYKYSLTDKGNNTFEYDSTEKQYIFTEILSIGESNIIITLSCDDTNYTINDTITTKFNVKYLRLYIKDTDIIELSIDSGVRDWTTVKSNILLNNVILYRYLNNDIYLPTKENLADMTKKCEGMQDGQFKYGTPSVNSDLDNKIKITTNEGNDTSISTNANTYIVGSTYYAYYSVSNPYQIVNMNSGDISNSNNYCIFKYKTVYDGNNYYTIEDALINSTSSNLYTWGNADSGTTYGLTTFTSLINIYDNTEYTSSKNIYVPHILNKDTLKDTNNIGSNVFSVFLIPKNITLNLTSSKLAACASFRDYTRNPGNNTMQRGVIYNNGTINITNGKVYAYGYIKGGGKLNLLGVSTAYDVLETHNWSGGSAATNISNRSGLTYNLQVVPFSEYSFHNISCETMISATVEYCGYFMTNVSIVGDVEVEVALLGSKSNTSGCIFKPTDNDSYIIKKAMNAVKKSTDSSLYSIDGSNQIAGQRDIIELYGNYEDSKFNFKLSLSIGTASLNTSTNMTLPISYMHITLTENSYLKIYNSDYILMPGTSIKIAEKAVCEVLENVDISVATAAKINSTYMPHCIDNSDAKLIINGKLILNEGSNIGGFIDTNSDTGILEIKGTTTSYYDIYYVAASPYRVSGNFVATAKLRSSNTTYNLNAIVSGKYTSQKLNNDTYVWSQTTARLEYVLNNGNGSLFSIVEHNVENGAVTINDPEIAEPAREHYVFAGWYKDELCTEEAFPYELFISSKVYAKWIPDTYNITYEYIYYDNCSSQDKISNPNPETYTYGNVNSLSTNVQQGNLVFGGWYLDPEHTQQITQLDANITGNTTLYGLWYPKGTIAVKINYEIAIDDSIPDEIKLILKQTDGLLTKESENVVITNINWTLAPYGTSYNNDISIPYWVDSWYIDENYMNKVESINSDTLDGATEITLYGIIRNKNKVEFGENDKDIFAYNSNLYDEQGKLKNIYLYPGQEYTLPTISDKKIKLENNDLSENDKYYRIGKSFNGFTIEIGEIKINMAENENLDSSLTFNYAGTIKINPNYLSTHYYKLNSFIIYSANIIVSVKYDIDGIAGTDYFIVDGEYYIKNGTTFTITATATAKYFTIITGKQYYYDNDLYFEIKENDTSSYQCQDNKDEVSDGNVTSSYTFTFDSNVTIEIHRRYKEGLNWKYDESQ